MTNPYILDRGLPQRSKLRYYFPTTEGRYTAITLPFFENPIIKEDKRARFKKYATVGRSSNLYSYHGSDSRKFTVSFNLTFPHIMDDHRDAYYYLNNYNVYRDLSNEEKVEEFKIRRVKNEDKGLLNDVLTKNYLSLEEVVNSQKQIINKSPFGNNRYINSRLGTQEDNTYLSTSVVDSISKYPFYTSEEEKEKLDKEEEERKEKTSSKSRHLDIVTFYVNLIRAGVINNAENPLLGPPVVRMIHGSLYRDIPCICEDYSISFNEDAGYDIDTLMPRQIRVTLKLEEFRTGNFGKFRAYSSDPILRDNLAGWE